MMYIRTKDGIHSVEAVPLSNGRIRYSLSNEDSLISKEDFEKITIREADTIEELCDEFVIEYFASEEVIQIRYPEFQWAKEDFESNKKGTLYGAIRVAGKGLIYVAKMNDNGVLELI